MEKNIAVNGEFIRLDALLKLAGYVSTGGHAKMVIQGGEVKVNGETCLMRTKKMRSGDRAEYNGNSVTVE